MLPACGTEPIAPIKAIIDPKTHAHQTTATDSPPPVSASFLGRVRDAIIHPLTTTPGSPRGAASSGAASVGQGPAGSTRAGSPNESRTR